MSASIWQVLNMKCIQKQKTEIMLISWNLFDQNSWYHNKWTIFVADFTQFERICGGRQ